MYSKSMQYSYRAQKHQRYRIFKFLFIIFILYVVYNCITSFFFSVWVVENDTMQPALAAGDRVIFTSFAPPSRFGRDDEHSYLFKRGSIVLVDMGRNKEQRLPLRILDGIVRFFTGQRKNIFSSRGQYYVKRVVAFPGDEISMNNYVFRIKPSGDIYSLTEFELSPKPYHPVIPQTPAIWNDSLPFSGSMETIKLGSGEFFLISDDRSNTNDSRTWGAVSSSFITARAVLRIWPLNKIELF